MTQIQAFFYHAYSHSVRTTAQHRICLTPGSTPLPQSRVGGLAPYLGAQSKNDAGDMLERRQCTAPGANSSVHHRLFDIVFTIFTLNFTCLSLALFKWQGSHGGCGGSDFYFHSILPGLYSKSLPASCDVVTHFCRHAFPVMKDCTPTNCELKYTLLCLRYSPRPRYFAIATRKTANMSSVPYRS